MLRARKLCLLLVISFLAMTLTSCYSVVVTKDYMEVKEGFKSYTFFLNTRNGYGDKIVEKQWQDLYKSFQDFGHGIGKRNLAVWVSEPKNYRFDEPHGKQVVDDIAKWSQKPINYEDGPFIVIMDQHPKMLKNTNNSQDEASVIIIGCKGISDKDLKDLLRYLESHLRQENLDEKHVQLKVVWLKMQNWWTQDADKKFIKEVILAGLGLLKGK